MACFGITWSYFKWMISHSPHATWTSKFQNWDPMGTRFCEMSTLAKINGDNNKKGTQIPNWGPTWEQCVTCLNVLAPEWSDLFSFLFFTCLSVLEVVAPEWSDLVLAANVPNSETDVLVFHRFDVEPWLFQSCMMRMNVETYCCIHNLTMAGTRMMVTRPWNYPSNWSVIKNYG